MTVRRLVKKEGGEERLVLLRGKEDFMTFVFKMHPHFLVLSSSLLPTVSRPALHTPRWLGS